MCIRDRGCPMWRESGCDVLRTTPSAVRGRASGYTYAWPRSESVSYTHLAVAHHGHVGGNDGRDARLARRIEYLAHRGEVVVVDDRVDREIGPVSYTHLDVYKRQCWSAARAEAACISSSAAIPRWTRRPTCAGPPTCSAWSMTPVSYTHLGGKAR